MNIPRLFQSVPKQDWLIISMLFIIILLLIALSELFRKKRIWSAEFTRKFVHIMVGVFTMAAPLFLQTALPMLLLGILFTIVNFVALQKESFKGMHEARKSYGTVFFPLTYLLLVWFAFPTHKILIVAAMATMTFGDAAAAIVGESITRPHRYHFAGESKSLEGSAAMFGVSAVCLATVLTFWHPAQFAISLTPFNILWISLLTALIITDAESLSSYGSDNLTVPLLTAVIMYFMLHHAADENLRFTLGVFLGAGAALLSYRLQFLTASGSAAMFLLAAVIFGFGGWKWTVPILTFFILSSLLSRMGKAAKSRYDMVFEKGSQRDYAQVLANGGVAGLMMILYMFLGREEIYLFYLAVLAAATADTWATELGTLSRQTPRLITSGKPVPPGTSGGITLMGLFSALIGALTILLAGLYFMGDSLQLLLPLISLLVVLSGWLASLVDSVLGATLQVQYRCPECGGITEKQRHCQNTETMAISGVHWIDNDMVNFFSTLSALSLCYLGWQLLI